MRAENVSCAACGQLVDSVRDLRFRKDGFDIVRCRTCGLLFRTQLPDERELEQIYDASYFFSTLGDTRGQGYRDYLAEEELHRDAARRRLDALASLTEPGSLLDIGAAAGFFVDEASRLGWDAQGIDIAPAMVSWGVDHLGVRLERCALDGAAFPAGSFDAVTMWDYIEHAVDPPGDLVRAAGLLRPGGVLALSTGDVASPVARVTGAHWHLLTPRHHNFFFTAPSLRRMLDRAGFDTLHVGHPGGRYSVRYLTYKLRTFSDAAPVRALAERVGASRLGAVDVPVNLGDIVTVHARKR